MATSEALSDILAELSAWCAFDIPDDRGSSPIGTKTLRAATLLYRTDPAALTAIRDRYVDVGLNIVKPQEPAASQQALFLEEVRQAYRQATSQEMENRRYGIPPPTAPERPPELPDIATLSLRTQSDTPRPSLYPALPTISEASVSTIRAGSLSSDAGSTTVDSMATSAVPSAASDAPASSMYERLRGIIRSPYDRFRSGGRPRQSGTSESTSGSSAATYSLASESLPFSSPSRQAATAAPAPPEPFRAEPLLPPLTAFANAFIDSIPRAAVGIRWELRRIAVDRPQDLEALRPMDPQDAGHIEASDRPHAETFTKLPCIARLIAGDSAVWTELDREHASRKEGGLRHLGGCPASNSDIAPPDWVSGHIRFVAAAEFSDRTKTFSVHLEPLRYDRSSVEARRRFGSPAFFELQTTDLKNADRRRQFADLVCGPKTLNGDVWRALVVDGASVHFMRTNEGASNESAAGPAELQDLETFLDWSGPFSQNGGQTMAKRVSRLRLLFSTTTPVRPRETWTIVRGADRSGEPDGMSDDPTNPVCMTDGAGLMGIGVAQAIRKALNLPHVPSVVQARICGSKGTWTIDLSEGPEAATSILIRQSQLKVRHLPVLDPSAAMLHINNPARVRMPGSLSWQVMSVLLARGVPLQTFKDLVELELGNVVAELTIWEPQNGETTVDVRRRLILAIQRRGIILERLAREQRVANRIGSDLSQSCEEPDDPSATVDVAWQDSNAASGQPVSLYQKAISKLSAGFSPQTDPLLAEEIYLIFKIALDKRLDTLRFPCPQSAIAIVIPDPYGVLKDGEVFFSFSEGFVDEESGLYVDRIVGDVCTFRHPCTLPIDIQRLRAVDCPQLNHLKDVVILPSVGPRPIASLLGGGDYDGDRLTVIWNKDVVGPFSNASLKYLDPPFKKEDIFDLDAEKVNQFVAALPPKGQARQDAIQRRLVQPINDQGFHRYYSDYHTRASYVLGIEHPVTIRLAHIAALGLDAPKLGLRIKPSVEKVDRQQWGEAFALPPFHPRSKRTDQEVGYNRRPLRRDPQLPPHPLDLLHQYVRRRVDESLAQINAQKKSVVTTCFADLDLDVPWIRFGEASADDDDERHDAKIIEAHVTEVRKEFMAVQERLAALRKTTSQTSDEATAAREAALEPVLRKFHRGLHTASSSLRSRTLRQHPDILARLKASCAYALFGHRGRKFPFDMAHAELCAIKKIASDGGMPGVSFDNAVAAAMLIDKRMVKVPEKGLVAFGESREVHVVV